MSNQEMQSPVLNPAQLRAEQKARAGQLMLEERFDDAIRVVSARSRTCQADGFDAVIVDPGFVHLQGHHYNSNVFFKRLLESYELRTKVLRIDRDNPSLEHDVTDAEPAFAFSPYEPGFFDHLPPARRAGLINQMYQHDFSHVLADSGFRLLVVHTARHNYIDGLCRYLSESYRKTGEPSKVVVGVIEAEVTSADHPDRQMALELYRRAFQRLQDLPDLRLLVFAETDEVVSFLADSMSDQATLIKLPYVGGYLNEFTDTLSQRSPTQPVIGFVGQSRAERGALIIHQIIAQVLADESANNVQWRVQLNQGFVRNSGAQIETLDVLAANDNVRFSRPDLPLAQYQELMADINIMVLPYSDRYNTTGSGIAIESLQLGHVLVAPRNSSMAALARKVGAGLVTFESAQVEAVANAVKEATMRFHELASLSRAAASIWASQSDAQLQPLLQFIRTP